MFVVIPWSRGRFDRLPLAVRDSRVARYDRRSRSSIEDLEEKPPSCVNERARNAVSWFTSGYDEPSVNSVCLLLDFAASLFSPDSYAFPLIPTIDFYKGNRARASQSRVLAVQRSILDTPHPITVTNRVSTGFRIGSIFPRIVLNFAPPILNWQQTTAHRLLLN